jgi:hypothetical protein
MGPGQSGAGADSQPGGRSGEEGAAAAARFGLCGHGYCSVTTGAEMRV